MLTKIIRYQAADMMKTRWISLVFLALLIITSGLFRLSENYEKVFSSLTNIIVILLPLLALLMGTIVFYNSRDYLLFLLTQPVHRRTIYTGMITGMTAPLILSVIAGMGIPMILFGEPTVQFFTTSAVMLVVASALCAVFIALSLLLSVFTQDKARALGAALFMWLLLTVLYDGFVLLIALSFSDYPLEMPMMILASFNPVDLSRIIILLNLDMSALMGYTGRLFQIWFGSLPGIAVSALIIVIWVIVPFIIGLRKFVRKDF